MQLKQIVEAALLAAGRPLSLDQLQALFDDAQGSASVAGGRKPGATDAQGRDRSNDPSAFPPSLEVRSASVAGGRKPGATDAEGAAKVQDGITPEAAEPLEGVSDIAGEAQQTANDDRVPDKKQLREVLDELTADYAGRGIEIREVGSGFRIQVRSEYSSWVSRLFAERPPKYSRALLETLALIAYRQPITRGEIEDIRGVSVSTNIIKTLTEREWVRVVGHRDVPGKPALYATTKEFLDYFNLKSLSDLPTLAEIRDLDSINRELELRDPDQYQPDEQDAEKTAANDAENPETNDSESVAGEADRGNSPDDEVLIEADPDGETDSGVAHEVHHAAPDETNNDLDDLSTFESDGETDALTDDAADADQQTKRKDDTE